MRIAIPTRIQGGLEYNRNTGSYILWLHTRDFVYGTYLELCKDGAVYRVTVRADEGDETVLVKPREEQR